MSGVHVACATRRTWTGRLSSRGKVKYRQRGTNAWEGETGSPSAALRLAAYTSVIQ